MAGCIAFAGFGCKGHDDSMKKMEKKDSMSSMNKESLYARLGGEPAIRAVVNDFVAITSQNPTVNFKRAGHPNKWEATPANIEQLKERLVQFIGMATGGPQRYEGKDMATAHRGMEITAAEFSASAGDLQKALAKNNVPKPLQDELIAVVAGTQGDIVGK
jgi:hemoglobin